MNFDGINGNRSKSSCHEDHGVLNGTPNEGHVGPHGTPSVRNVVAYHVDKAEGSSEIRTNEPASEVRPTCVYVPHNTAE